MTEYWVNVYNSEWWICRRPISEHLKHATQKDAIEWCKLFTWFYKPATFQYRIHVKLKRTVYT